ncbi:MAG: hypothetical protein M2R45_02620 [Verrucomicrobia subdivision 3 bacterium]|nr:hypothetical protein [Limisphaerales bacterium]MCS1416412.1 hypothetical protein [Limisphaerales bacterium]
MMSRENRMLILFFVGMVALSTYFRIQYPNIGAVDDDRPVQRAPFLRVACADGRMAAVEKVVRAYELEFGVRVRLDRLSEVSGPVVGYDLMIRGDRPTPAGEAGGVNFFTLGAERDDEIGSGRVVLTAVGFSVTASRRHGAARLARYLTARDKGAPIIAPDAAAQLVADPWIEKPEPIVLVWEAVFPFLQSALRRFEANEGVRLRLMVGDCAFVSRKVEGAGMIDAVVSLGDNCGMGGVVSGWDTKRVSERRLVMLTRQEQEREPFIGGDSREGQKPLNLGIVDGTDGLIMKRLWQSSLPASLLERWREQTVREYARPHDLLHGLARYELDVGIAVEWPAAREDARIKLEPIPGESVTLPIVLSVSERSNHRRLLFRLGASMDRSDPVVAKSTDL